MNAPLHPSDFIGELCVALAHRWEPERLFVIFTAYIDESGTHGRNPDVVMGAFLAHAYQWRIFNRDLDRIRERYGFNIFHAKDFKALRGEFEGWEDEKCLRLIDDLIALVRDRLTRGATIHLERDLYLRGYREKPFPPKMQPDSQFGVCFRALLAYLVATVAATGKSPRLHVVVEAGHENVGCVDPIFREFKERLQRNGVELLGTVTRAEKVETKELMVADFLAHSHTLMRNDASEPIDYAKLVQPVPRDKAGLTFLVLTERGLDEMKAHFLRDKQEKIEVWRRQRDARRKASSSAGRQPS
jgi:hypothetical protein